MLMLLFLENKGCCDKQIRCGTVYETTDTILTVWENST